MNWIERMYELKGKDLYAQNGEGLYLEYIFRSIGTENKHCIDIGGGDGFYLSNTYHLLKSGFTRVVLDRETGQDIDLDTLYNYINNDFDLLSIDIDGNDYWIVNELLDAYKPRVIIAEFNSSYTDSRTIKYNPIHIWMGDSYYGFTFEAGKKLAEKHGYKVIFQVANMNMILVREDLVKDIHIPEVTYDQSTYFKMSERTDWEFI